MSRRSPWLALWFLWAIPAAIVVINLLWLFGLRGAVIGRGSLMAKQQSQVEEEVGKLEERLRSLEKSQGDLARLQAGLGNLRQEQLGGMRSRLVLFLLDVVRRAHEAGLSPEKVAYQVQEQPKSGLVHFAATYAVKGTYQQVRQLISLLESSPQFILVERLALRGDEGAGSLDISVNLSLATYFSDLDLGLVADLGIEELESEIGGDMERAAVDSRARAPRKAEARPAARPPVAGASSGRDAEGTRLVQQGGSEAGGRPATPQVRRLSSRTRTGSAVRPEMTEPVDEFYTNVGVREVSGGN